MTKIKTYKNYVIHFEFTVEKPYIAIDILKSLNAISEIEEDITGSLLLICVKATLGEQEIEKTLYNGIIPKFDIDTIALVCFSNLNVFKSSSNALEYKSMNFTSLFVVLKKKQS